MSPNPFTHLAPPLDPPPSPHYQTTCARLFFVQGRRQEAQEQHGRCRRQAQKGQVRVPPLRVRGDAQDQGEQRQPQAERHHVHPRRQVEEDGRERPTAVYGSAIED